MKDSTLTVIIWTGIAILLFGFVGLIWLANGRDENRDRTLCGQICESKAAS